MDNFFFVRTARQFPNELSFYKLAFVGTRLDNRLSSRDDGVSTGLFDGYRIAKKVVSNSVFTRVWRMREHSDYRILEI